MNRRALVQILVAFALLFIAATIRSGWLYLVASVLFAMVILALVSGWRATRRLTILRECPEEVFEGEPFDVSLHVRNDGRLSRYLVTVRDVQLGGRKKRSILEDARRRREELRGTAGRSPSTTDRDEGASRTVTFENLPPEQDVSVTYDLAARRRGVYGDGELVVSSGGIFGSGEIRRTLRVDSPLTVFPAVTFLEAFPATPSPAAMPAEVFDWSRKGAGQDYYGVREYARGDSLRDVHWRLTAKQGELIVKEYEREMRPSTGILLLLDAPEAGDDSFNSLEDGLRAAASIIDFQAARGGLPSLVIPRGGGFELVEFDDVRGYFRHLAAYEPPAGRGPAGGLPGLLVEGMTFAGRNLPGGPETTFVMNSSFAEAEELIGLVAVAGPATVVLVLEDSYAEGWSTDRSDEIAARFAASASGRPLELFLVTRERGMARCLTEPLITTGA